MEPSSYHTDLNEQMKKYDRHNSAQIRNKYIHKQVQWIPLYIVVIILIVNQFSTWLIAYIIRVIAIIYNKIISRIQNLIYRWPHEQVYHLFSIYIQFIYCTQYLNLLIWLHCYCALQYILQIYQSQKINMFKTCNNSRNSCRNEPIPMPINVVNIEALKLVCHKTSQRYAIDSSKSKEKAGHESNECKKKAFRTSKIYFKKRKQREDEMYFSDYKIKYGSMASYLREASENKTIQNQEEATQRNKVKFMNTDRAFLLNSAGYMSAAEPKHDILVSKPVPVALNCPPVSAPSNMDEQEYNKRKAVTKMERRKLIPAIKMSFSYKNYKKINAEQQRASDGDNDNNLEGWAVQTPLFEVDRKLDIIDYAVNGNDQVRQYFSERKKIKPDSRKLSRSKKLSIV